MSTAEWREESHDVPWYHVCERCNAKWFAIARRATCPRCERRSHSMERLVPPWWRRCQATSTALGNRDPLNKT